MRLVVSRWLLYVALPLLGGREAEMRNINERTNSRVAWLSVMSLLVCVGLAAFQLWYLKSYFERKKLL